MTIPASVRFNNPGAMWGKGNKIATAWGATSTTALNDGLGQGNNIAAFPTKIQGACAQFALWRAGYVNMTLEAADRKWSGGNSSPQYLAFLCGKVPQLTPTTVVTSAILAGPLGWQLMKYQAQWEAGEPYPMSDSDWQNAQSRVFNGKAPVTAVQKKTAAATGAVVVAGAAAGQAAKSGVHWGIIVGIVLAGVVGAVGMWFLMHYFHEKAVTPPPPPPPAAPPSPPIVKG